MKQLFYLFLAVMFMASCTQSVDETEEAQTEPEEVTVEETIPVKDGVFIHISSGPEEAHRVLMALSMADKMSDDKDVIVYFDINGVFVVLNDAPDITFKEFESSKTLLQKLIDKGVVVQACPGCLKAAEKTEADLMEGIVIAEKERFFNFTEGRILTMDY